MKLVNKDPFSSGGEYDWWASGKSLSDFIYVYTHPKLEE